MTWLFAPAGGPRVFGLPPGIDFGRALRDGLDARLAGQPPEAVARVEIWVNTQRARRMLAEAFAEGPARLLPRIRVVTELAVDPMAPVALPPEQPPLRRKLELARLIRALVAAEPRVAAETAVFDLADSLAELLDELQGEGLDPACLGSVDTDRHAEHWQRSLRFLEILREYVAESGTSGIQGRMRAVAAGWAEAWSEAPPDHPVIVAGSTGSRAATRTFMAAVARLPQGALVLPGLDFDLPSPVWQRLDAKDAGAADHPQHGFRRLAEMLGFDPASVPAWHDAPPPVPERNALVSLALRPAPVTDQWRSDGRALAGRLGSALENLDWVEAPDPRSEARVIALALREAAETGQRAALITPDRSLARRVTAELDRWRLLPDDSAGRPLGLTPPGTLLRHLADCAGQPLTPESLLILLKHPLVASAPGGRSTHGPLVRRLEREKLRGGAPVIDWQDLAFWAATTGDGAAAWIGWLEGALVPLSRAGRAELQVHVTRQRTAAERLAAGPEAAEMHGLWDKDAGAEARALMEDLALHADAGEAMSAVEYRALLMSQMAARDVPEEAVVTDAGIAIWGTLEARVQSADLVILGGINEGIWPRHPQPDPWLSRGLRAEIGLPSPEVQVGLSAHDFQQAICAARVILTRATRDAEAPTVASRWLLRLGNLLAGLGPEGAAALEAARDRGAKRLAQAASLDRPPVDLMRRPSMQPARRPSPRPPLAARPNRLSVTQIETLVRDPYAIYAKKVLDLRPLDPPGRQADALARGSALHAALERFVDVTAGGLPEDARDILAQSVVRALDETTPWPAVRAIWASRMDRAADWFLREEAVRRMRGRPAAREVRGEHSTEIAGRPFTIHATADRLDVTPDGRVAIYDYKSGGVPSAKEAAAFHLQLPLEAIIAAAGGFAGLAAAQVAHLELIGLGARKSLLLDPDPEALAETWAHLKDLITRYRHPQTGFTARLRPQLERYVSDYDHLSRKGEWADGDEPEGAA